MTAEPVRHSNDDPARERATPRAGEPVEAAASVDTTTRADATASGEATASMNTSGDASLSMDTSASTDTSASVDATALEGSMGAPAVDAPTTEAPTSDVPLAAAAVAEAETPAVAKPSRRPVIASALRWVGVLALTVALFAGGVALGNLYFLRTHPAKTLPGEITVTAPPPAVAQEFIFALGNNDADALRSSLDMQPNKDLTDEFTRFDIKKITSVETLGTSVDGNRSATEILLHAEKSNGLPFEVNLVIMVDGNKIEGFR